MTHVTSLRHLLRFTSHIRGSKTTGFSVELTCQSNSSRFPSRVAIYGAVSTSPPYPYYVTFKRSPLAATRAASESTDQVHRKHPIPRDMAHISYTDPSTHLMDTALQPPAVQPEYSINLELPCGKRLFSCGHSTARQSTALRLFVRLRHAPTLIDIAIKGQARVDVPFTVWWYTHVISHLDAKWSEIYELHTCDSVDMGPFSSVPEGCRSRQKKPVVIMHDSL